MRLTRKQVRSIGTVRLGSTASHPWSYAKSVWSPDSFPLKLKRGDWVWWCGVQGSLHQSVGSEVFPEWTEDKTVAEGCVVCDGNGSRGGGGGGGQSRGNVRRWWSEAGGESESELEEMGRVGKKGREGGREREHLFCRRQAETKRTCLHPSSAPTITTTTPCSFLFAHLSCSVCLWTFMATGKKSKKRIKKHPLCLCSNHSAWITIRTSMMRNDTD